MNMDPNLDYYGILGLSLGATKREIRSAYKKQALKVHPDKNPDDLKAAEVFLQLKNALEVLLDDAIRTEYDNLIKAKHAAQLRHKALDEKRKKFKEDLEAKEKETPSKNQISEEEKMSRRVEMLRAEGAKLLEQEVQSLQEQLILEPVVPIENEAECLIKVRWNITDGSYTDASLKTIFSKYGDVESVVVIKNKALIKFKETSAAAFAQRVEIGFMGNPLKVKLLSSTLRTTPDVKKVEEREAVLRSLVEELMNRHTPHN